jgi:hypothetical protein
MTSPIEQLQEAASGITTGNGGFDTGSVANGPAQI